jgi:formamidopyrimidine-DNA glycosylase
MPEAPELEVVKEFLNVHLAGRSVTRAAVLRPVVLRSLVEDDFADDVVGRVFGRTERRGKVLLLPLEPERMPPDIHIKVRDSLKEHRKGGQPCPRCGHTISEITANQRITSYCRRCQPGMLIRN